MVHQIVSRRAALAGGTGALALAACSTTSSPAPAASPPAAGRSLARLADLAVGEAHSVSLPDGTAVIVVRTSSDTVRAFSARCTHAGCVVKPQGQQLLCPCHRSRFDAATGAVLHGPANRPLERVAVTVRGGEVVTA